ncbi:MAG: STAS domain-containing protein, partial [Gaiellaceae bacterium]
ASAGARSQLSGLIVAALTAVTLLFLTGLFEQLPEETLAAVVVAALIELVDVRSLVRLYRASRPHVAQLGHVPGTRSQYADVARHPENEVVPGVAVLRVEGGLFFANADAVRERVRAAVTAEVGAIVLDAEAIPFVDGTAVGMLGQLAEELESRAPSSFSPATSARCGT